MTSNDLVSRIYSLNDVKDGFWKDYLDRIRNGIKVTWYPSSGFDLRPLETLYYYRQIKSITDIVYSDIGHYYDNYALLMNIWHKSQEGTLNDKDMPDFIYSRLEFLIPGAKNLPARFLESIVPFALFTIVKVFTFPLRVLILVVWLPIYLLVLLIKSSAAFFKKKLI